MENRIANTDVFNVVTCGSVWPPLFLAGAEIDSVESFKFLGISRLLPNRSPVAWGFQRIALGALIFHSNTFLFICCSAGNNFSLFRGHMSFQIFLLVGHLTNWTGHNLLTDNTLKKRTQDVLVTCSVIVSDHNVKLARHFQNLVGQCPMTDCYFQH